MKTYLIFLIISIFLSFTGCASQQHFSPYSRTTLSGIITIEPVNKIPLKSGSSINSIIGQCVTAIDNQGYAQIEPCNGKFNGYYTSINASTNKTDADLHTKGLFRINNKLTSENKLAEKGAYYSEYKVNNQYFRKPKNNYSVNELDTLHQSCKKHSTSSQYIIETAYFGCSVTEYIHDLNKFNLQYVNNIFKLGERKKGVSIIGKPIHFDAAYFQKNSASCQTPEIFAVGVKNIDEICARISTHRATRLQNEIDSLQTKIVSLYNGNSTLTEKIAYYEQGTKDLSDKINICENNINILNTKIAGDDQSSGLLLSQIELHKNELNKLEYKLNQEYKKSSLHALKSPEFKS